MDKNVLKKFAVESRQELMEKVANKINKYFVDEYFDVNQNGEVYILINNKHTLRLTKSEYENRQLLVKRIKEITLEQVIEEAAYTWFNRIIAIRYMEIHNFLPLTKDNQSLGVRVLSSKDNTPDPEIMKISNLMNPDLDINFNKEYYGSIQDNNKRFEYILLLVCKKLGRVIPQVFDGVTDYIDILIPDNLLNESGYITNLLNDIPSNYFIEQVEIIGWLYQYYISEKKDIVFSNMKKNKKIKKQEIPAATQLFTPDWIVKYLVQNSLGRLWNNNFNDELKENWEYFINDDEREKNNFNIKDIKVIDPCSGSGHILVYIFEMLFEMYNKLGYTKEDIPQLIIKDNLYGLDIDDRAAQLSNLSVLLKAREYDKKIFNKINNTNIISIQESDYLEIEDLKLICKNEETKEVCEYILKIFKNAKEFGSLIKIKQYDYKALEDEINKFDLNRLNIIERAEFKKITTYFLPLVKQANLLCKRYDCIITNPPYMGNPSEKLTKYIQTNYQDSKYDTYATFIERNFNNLKENGYQAMVTGESWLFLSSFERLRKKLREEHTLVLLNHLGFGAFDNGFGTVAFIYKNKKIKNYISKCIRLTNSYNKEEELSNKIKKCELYYMNVEKLYAIKGEPLAYWVPEKLLDIFQNPPISNKIITKAGIVTGNNELFMKLWYEVNYKNISFNCSTFEDIKNIKWVPTNKGGGYRKWYGNQEYVVNLHDIWDDTKVNKSVRRGDPDYYFKKGITWSTLSNKFGVRASQKGFVCDTKGSMCFVKNDNDYYYIIGLLNSSLAEYVLNILTPTLDFNKGYIEKIPYKETKDINRINCLVKEYITISKQDWDSFEISWDFKKHPLLEFIDSMPGLHDSNIKVTPTHLKIIKNSYGEECYIADELPLNAKISDSFRKWEEYTQKQFNTLKKNEEKLNEIFIDIYGLKDELTPEVEDKDIAIRKADKEREIKSLISYAVGCMFGRYSLDKEGLIYAGGDFDEKYKKYKESDGGWAGVSLSNYKVLNDNGNEIDLSFEVDKDNIIPITDEAYLGDDIVERFKKFISVAYGEETLYENLESIAETLGKRNGETSEDTIRRYFINDFYNDHLKIYQKRPIYWLFDSGKKNGFKCLIYMHRYNEGLVSKIRLDYLHKIQNIYEKELKEISNKLDGDIDLTKKRELAKTQADISAKLQETKEYDEKIAHIADQKIKIDLDDGVVVNYAKFSVKNPKTGREESLLAKIK